MKTLRNILPNLAKNELRDYGYRSVKMRRRAGLSVVLDIWRE
jgi:hypothetical protein